MELKGNQEHREVCRGEPLEGSKQALKIQIGELEKKLATATAALKSAQATAHYWQGQHDALAKRSAIFGLQERILNAAKSWWRAKEARNGKTEAKLDALKLAISELYVKPIDEPSLSIMITGKPYEPQVYDHADFGKHRDLKPLPDNVKTDLLLDFQVAMLQITLRKDNP